MNAKITIMVLAIIFKRMKIIFNNQKLRNANYQTEIMNHMLTSKNYHLEFIVTHTHTQLLPIMGWRLIRKRIHYHPNIIFQMLTTNCLVHRQGAQKSMLFVNTNQSIIKHILTIYIHKARSSSCKYGESRLRGRTKHEMSHQVSRSHERR